MDPKKLPFPLQTYCLMIASVDDRQSKDADSSYTAYLKPGFINKLTSEHNVTGKFAGHVARDFYRCNVIPCNCALCEADGREEHIDFLLTKRNIK